MLSEILKKKQKFLSPKSYRKVNLQVHLQRSKKCLICINKKKQKKSFCLFSPRSEIIMVLIQKL